MENEISKTAEVIPPSPQPEPRKRRISRKKVAVILIALVIVAGFAYQQFEINSLLNQNKDLKSSLTRKEQDYDTLYDELQTAQQNYNRLQERYDELHADYASLEEEYRGALKVPYATIKEGNVTWAFKTLDGTIEDWYMPLDTYTYYVNAAKPTEYHLLTSDGDSFRVRNMELLVQPDFFSKVIDSLADGRTARDFVKEVFNLRVQLTLYSSDITDTPQWSAETLTEGTGDCEDFAILMGSLLVAGNNYADYGMTVQMLYMDADNPTNPQTVNHASLYVKYGDGTGQFVDSTSLDVMSPWSSVVGWYYDIS